MSTNQSSNRISEDALSLGLLEGSMAQLHISASDSDSISLSSLFEPSNAELDLQDSSGYEEEEDTVIISHLAHSTLTEIEILEWQQRIAAELEVNLHVLPAQATPQFQVGVERTTRRTHRFNSVSHCPPHPDCWIGLSFGSPHTGVFLRRFGMISGRSTPHISSPYMELELPQTIRHRRKPLGSLNVPCDLSQSDPWDDPHYIPEMGRRSALFYPQTQILVPS